MKENTISVAAYWRNSLADAELGRGGWHDSDISSLTVRGRSELTAAMVERPLADELFRTEDQDCQFIEVAVYPMMFKLRTEHGSRKQYSLPGIITPVVIKSYMSRDGRITPTSKIFITRDLLDPLDKDSFGIGHIDDLDSFLTNTASPVPANILKLAGMESESNIEDEQEITNRFELLDAVWKDVLLYCETMLTTVCPDDMIRTNGYLKTREWVLKKIGGNDTPSKRISSLYDHMRQANPDTPLLDNFASFVEIEEIDILDKDSGFSNHVGHCSDLYPLAEAQRDALNHINALKNGDILAVNGPPGTGKTTLLLTAVANLWVEKALAEEDPPVIVAASTNNQSVTNIIDAFKKDISDGNDDFSGRWISGISSYGMYLASRLKRQQSGARYIGVEDLEAMESVDRVAQYRDDYLYYAREAFTELKAPSVKTVVARLHQEMLTEYQNLVSIKTHHDQLQSLLATQEKALGANHWETLAKIDADAEDAKKKYKTFESAYINLVNHIGSQPFWYDLLRFIPSVQKQQGVRASIVVKRTIKGIPPDKIWDNVESLKSTLMQKIKALKAVSEKLQTRQRKAHALVRKIAETRTKLSESYKAVMKLDSVAVPQDPRSITEANILADNKIRFKLFRLATHYWEGRWLLEVDGQHQTLIREMGSLTPEALSKRWKRRMMLTPCAVSTFFMLPGEFKTHIENDKKRHSYLYDFIDLLIVDEAGQVLPEVGGASFALAKKAIVIGDTLQIEPIWNIPKTVDIGNLVQSEVLEKNLSEECLVKALKSGKMASSGNVMTIAQERSAYHYDKELARGMFLYEHRRCFNEIISYCNALAYKNKLIPSRGRHLDLQMPPNPWPPMGYVNVYGQCKTKTTGTRFNLLEAQKIAEWLSFHKEEIERLYGAPIEETVGIVTPFSGQVEAIRLACKKVSINVTPESGITIGTVHSLQGAERAIVIFSATYTKENNGGFIDSSNSMLNVAVSRAKDNFIVFGDMRTFNPKQSFTPRGLLATFLLRSDENRIQFGTD